MRQIQKLTVFLALQPDRFGEIDDHILPEVPRQENAKFGFPLWSNGRVQKSDARGPSARIRQDFKHAQRIGLLRVEMLWDCKTLDGRSDFVQREARRGACLELGKPMIRDHVFEPKAELIIRSRSTKVFTRRLLQQ